MERIPEPELMVDPEQVLAYARADFSKPHNLFIDLIIQRFGPSLSGTVLDLGCGPGDICRRFARRFPNCRIHGVDASAAMLELAITDTRDQSLDGCITYIPAHLPKASLPLKHYDILVSNSLLHHLEDPAGLWKSIVNYGRTGTMVFVMDLLRPENCEQARQLQKEYAGNEPEVLQKDFFNSLLAAYRPGEVREQLAQHGLDQLRIEVVSDRHFIAFGSL
ncbi:MAG: methyltransferase domain-containing protein [Gammaproteobacteria bacterium]|nr:methyltransferase domain-containing protein [Gammaproteobacteria bacterium]